MSTKIKKPDHRPHHLRKTELRLLWYMKSEDFLKLNESENIFFFILEIRIVKKKDNSCAFTQY